MPITTTSFTSVNVGTSANDGTGDELRNAFIKVNSNFSNISTVGFNSGNILVSGNVQAVYFVGDGSQLVNVSSSNAYANANVAAYLVAYNGIVTASNVFVAGNVTSQWFLGKANVSSIITTDLGASGMIYANAGVNSTSTGTGALVVKQLTIPAGETVFFSDERIVLNAGDQIKATASTANLLSITVSSLPV
jgi:hypothetical protein